MTIATLGDIVSYDDGSPTKASAIGVVMMGPGGATPVGNAAAPLVVQPNSSAAAVTTVASGIASVTIKAANTARRGLTVLNTDANVLYLLVGGGTASATNLSVIVAATTGYWEAPYGFTGAITGIWAADGAGSAYVTEYT